MGGSVVTVPELELEVLELLDEVLEVLLLALALLLDVLELEVLLVLLEALEDEEVPSEVDCPPQLCSNAEKTRTTPAANL